MAVPAFHSPRQSDTSTVDRHRRQRRRAAAVVALLALVGGAVWATRPAAGDPAKVQQLRAELFGEAGRALADDARRAKMTEFRDEVRQLSDEQRAELMAAGQREEKARLEKYFASNPAEKVRQLDEAITRSEKARAERAKRTPLASGTGPGNGRPGPGVTVNAVQSASGSDGAGSPPGSGSRVRSPEQTEQRRKVMLDRTTPDQRALMDQVRALREKYRKDLDQRRQQRGMPPTPTRGGPGLR